MEWEIRQSLPQWCIPWKGLRSPGRCSSWELEFRHCGAIPVWGLLLTSERWVEEMGGRRSWEMPVEEIRAALEARRYCWVTHGAGAITKYTFSSRISRSYSNSMFNFLRNHHINLSISISPFYIPTISAKGSNFSTSFLINTCLLFSVLFYFFNSSHSIGCKVISLWVRFSLS